MGPSAGMLLVRELIIKCMNLTRKHKHGKEVSKCPLRLIVNTAGVPAEAYRVFFQGLHEKRVPEDEPAVLCHLGLLLRTVGTGEGKKKTSGEASFQSLT